MKNHQVYVASVVIAGLAALFKSTQPLGISDASAFLFAMERNPHGGAGVPPVEWNQETGYGIPNAFSTIWATACPAGCSQRTSFRDCGFHRVTLPSCVPAAKYSP